MTDLTDDATLKANDLLAAVERQRNTLANELAIAHATIAGLRRYIAGLENAAVKAQAA